MIDINKKYRTKDGREVRIYATDGAEPYSVHGSIKTGDTWGSPVTWLDSGQFDMSEPDRNSNLVEVGPYEDFKIDDPVMVSDDGYIWLRRHFAGVSEDGEPLVFMHGKTSWSTEESSTRPLGVRTILCRRPTPEELSHVGA